MATILFSAIGTLVGGPIGGAVGALVGRQADALLIGGGRREGPRLKDLAVTTSSYGTALPRLYGRMRVPGTIIWATELTEHGETQGGGKGRPKVTTYSYSASFAVALASRPIQGIGRIWADGNLLRGASGDLKTGGAMRIYTGHGDQPADPLIAVAEGAGRCPAWRGLAYVVFEELDLADFYNRIPALTFEVIADDSFTLQDVVGETIAEADCAVALEEISGLSCEGPLADTLRSLEPAYALHADAGGEGLTIARERLQAEPILLPEPAIAGGDAEFGRATGQVRRRSPPSESPPEILRYYDLDRDYLPGLQRAAGRPGAGQPQTLELPATLSAADARALVERTAQRARWARETIAWRCASLDPAVAPGSVVALPGQAGRWLVDEWEWRETGVELALSRIVPSGADARPAATVDPGRINPAADLGPATTVLAAFELPWDGSGSADTPAVFAALSSAGANWSGAALFVDHGDGALQPLGPSGRTRAVLGAAETALAAASPLLFDRSSSVTVALTGADLQLVSATGRQLAMGANRALLGEEIVQFAEAVPLGGGRWRLRKLLRGRGGTEAAIAGHAVGERFVLLDARLVSLDHAAVGTVPQTSILALGRADEVPAETPIALAGTTLRPLSPVHPRTVILAGGALELRWTRRARGAWSWPDGVDAPLQEQSELYQVGYGDAEAPLFAWTVDEARLQIPAAVLVDLAAALPGGDFHVRQKGSHALSAPLYLHTLT